ncbi:helix-turn-helix domain-containing protein [Paracoccus methylarcula]|uniref:Ner winged helix-turn-helix DNA-binding domain-containing protein n=1 Tax=Paracoccus methylarcula TaxID=72022 RepID=A0A422QZC8_9RHOB|nr:hypothetical protein A7A09_006940 [Paracoccus methylarcula]
MARLINMRTHELVKAELRIAGSSLAQVGRELGISHASVGSACAGYSRSRRVEEAIASKLLKRPEEIWPERYPTMERGER